MIIVQSLWSGAAELLLFFSSASIGGLALSEGKMALFLSSRPLLVCFFTMLVCPWLFRTYNCLQILRGSVFIPPLFATAFWLLSITAGNGTATPVLTVFLLAIVLVFQMLANPVFLASNVLVNARSPTGEQLSRLNAWAELITQIGIGLGAELGSTIYAWSNAHQIQQGRLPWILLIGFSSATAWVTQSLTHRDGWRERNFQAAK